MNAAHPRIAWRHILALCVALAAACTDVRAGNDCERVDVTPQKVAAAAATAQRVAEELDRVDAPVALVSRIGTDLSRHGLVYSHAGFAVRDHPKGRWTVVHLLRDCSSDGSGLYTQGLGNFFADDLVNQDARITWLEAEMAERLAQRLLALRDDPLYTPRYNLIARPGSTRTQNSTAWIVEHLGAALSPRREVTRRSDAYTIATAYGFRPDTIHIPYSKRIAGGLFGSHISFTDHPVGTRLSGDYPVVTVRAILRWLGESGLAVGETEWRNGVRQSRPGPA